jgi:hypothetical protein
MSITFLSPWMVVEPGRITARTAGAGDVVSVFSL